jgi:molybdate transport system ATP-binding protein
MTLSVSIRHALPDLELDVSFGAPDGVTALFGRSGAGKSTVVQAISGLLCPDTGRIAVGDRVLFDKQNGVDLPVSKRRVGYVFQDDRLFPHLSVHKNLLYGARTAKPSSLDQVLGMLDIEPLLTRMPAGLSGGERQRVAIGRALLSSPEIVLMDEPLASLDDARKREILPYLERLRDEARVPIVYVSHSLAEVARLATTVVVLDRGRVKRSGPTIDVLSDPDAVPDLGVREAGSLLRARVEEHLDDGLSELALGEARLYLPRIAAPVGAEVRVRIQAKDVMLSVEQPRGLSALNILPVIVESMRSGEGPGVMVRLLAGEDYVLARITRRSAEALGIVAGKQCFAVMKSVSVAHADVGVLSDDAV